MVLPQGDLQVVFSFILARLRAFLGVGGCLAGVARQTSTHTSQCAVGATCKSPWNNLLFTCHHPPVMVHFRRMQHIRTVKNPPPEGGGLAKRLAQRKFLTSGLLRKQQREGLQERPDATLVRTTSSHAEADDPDGTVSTPLLPSRRVIAPRLDLEEGNPLRVPVVDSRGIALMPCTPAKARHLLKSGKAHPKRNKLGLFYIQLCYEQEPDTQPLVVGIDPGSKFEGASVVGSKDTVTNLKIEAPAHVKDAVLVRRTMRRARRGRLWRRPKRPDNRLSRKPRIPPSTRSRWEAKARVVRQLLLIMPLTAVVVEDVQAATRTGKGGKWNTSFS